MKKQKKGKLQRFLRRKVFRYQDKLLYQIKNNLRTGENLSDFIRKAVRSYLAIVQTE
jgi:hypothetical protein